MASKYDESSIKHLGYRDATRQKAGFYIGSTDDVGLFTILREILDNTVDEALSGHCTQCHAHINMAQNDYWVYDDGRGMPVGDITITEPTSGKKVKMPALQAIVSLHHAGGKISTDTGKESAYQTSRGTHGLGQKATNFLSDLFEVFTFNKGKWWTIQFKKGLMTRPLTQCKAPKHPATGKTLERGTLVHFQPDFTIFSKKSFSLKFVDSWANLAAYFTPNFKVILTNEKNQKKVYHAPGGPKQFVKDRVEKLNCTPLSPDTFVYQNALVDCVIKFTDYDGCELQAFTNGLMNVEGGKHHQSTLAAIMAAIQPFAKKKQDFTQVELREGIVGLINAKLSAPKFDSQTKEKLVDDRCGTELRQELTTAFKKFFSQNKSLAEKICTRCSELKNLRNKFVASKTVLKELKAVSKKGLPAKAAISPNCKPEQRELLLLEGDSAAGSARDARDPKFQEILPLRGKIMNALKAKDEQVLLSKEVLYILNMLGYDPKTDNPMSKLRVKGKIIFLADPDPDGPLLGNTLVPIKFEGQRFQVTMEALASDVWLNRNYKVLTRIGDVFKWVQAHDCQLVANVDKMVTITLETGKTIKCSEFHRWPAVVKPYDPRIIDLGSGAHYLGGPPMMHACKLKPGDILISPFHSGEFNPEQELAGVSNFHKIKIVSVKVQKCDPTPVYCLTVPFSHNFLISNGVMTGNCHINSLLLALFFKYLPEVFDLGMVYIAEAPEYYALKKDGTALFAKSAPELKERMTKANLKLEIHHVKGYGEFPAHLLKQVAFDPDTRSITQIKPLTKGDHVEFVKLMSESSEARKDLLGV